MEAKCPYCEDGCDKCEGGTTTVTFASGYVFTRACQDPQCGFKNGGRITKLRVAPNDSSGKCVWCGADTEWEYSGDMLECDR